MDNIKLSGSFSIWNKTLVIKIDEELYDISHLVDDGIWRMSCNGDDLNINNPYISWQIRVKLAKIATKYVQEYLGRDDIFIQC